MHFHLLGFCVCFQQEKLKPKLATVFAMMQKSVIDMSKRIYDEMKRYNYVTPTNYLELVSGYKQLAKYSLY